ncbi:hypothetical protein Cgig2_007167 [Carnegiea gigantea]|uniref:Uncharacterized protein n=1 Tax=Carnegiea gigantea TaxID=171969 RepID=A0A9Q1JS83_9CARY|nr:hypothetical protein Cgig2_007167 [Carnegiea gigantea]
MEIVPLVHPILGFRGQEANPIGMIHLPLRFGDKVKVKSLEVDSMAVDVPTAYNVILGRQAQHKAKKFSLNELRSTTANRRPVGQKRKQPGVNKNPWALDIRLFIIVVVPIRNGFIALVIQGPSFAFQRHGLLITEAASSTVGGKRQGPGSLRVPEKIRYTSRNPKNSPDAQPWSLYQPRPWLRPPLWSGVGAAVPPSQTATKLRLSLGGLQGLFLFLYLLPTAFILGHGVDNLLLQEQTRQSGPYNLYHSGEGLPGNSTESVEEKKRDREEKRWRKGLGLTSATATCSSVTLNGSPDPKGAKA